MKFRTLLAFVVLQGAVYASPLIDEPTAIVKLNNGRILYDAQAKSFSPKVVMVRHRDGMETIAYELFPSELQPALSAKRPRERTPEEIAAAKAEAARNQPKKSHPAPKAIPGNHRGLIITSVAPAGQLARVWISNPSGSAQSVYPWDIIGTSDDGSVARGLKWVGLGKDGQIAVIRESHQLIAPNETLELTLMFERFRGSSIVASAKWE